MTEPNGNIVWSPERGWHDGPPARVSLDDAGRIAIEAMTHTSEPIESITAEIGTSGTFATITLASERLDIAEAVEHEHDCDDEGCDITHALAHGYVYAAAYLLSGATEVPLLDAIVEHYGTDLDPNGAHASEWDDWADWHRATGSKCASCEGYTYRDAVDDDLPDWCAHCGASLIEQRRDALREALQFDHVVRVHTDGSVTDEPEVYAPDVADGEGMTEPWIDPADPADRWTLLDGYSRQDGYPGPVMHPSELIGRTMADDILTEPGVYVAVVVTWIGDDDGSETDGNPVGWVVARLRDDPPAGPSWRYVTDVVGGETFTTREPVPDPRYDA